MVRVGFGYDSHRFAEGRELVLGGVLFPGERGLLGHSDADVLTHAVIDALLGAAALGDIGSHFPDSDAAWKGASSIQLLRRVVAEVREAGFDIGNIDATVICETPRLRPFIDKIRASLAEALSLDVRCVSVKGKTNEKMDDVGASLGIESHAVCLLTAN